MQERSFSDEQLAKIEVVFADGSFAGKLTDLSIDDRGVLVETEGLVSFYPWHEIREIRGLPERKKTSAYEDHGLRTV